MTTLALFAFGFACLVAGAALYIAVVMNHGTDEWWRLGTRARVLFSLGHVLMIAGLATVISTGVRLIL